MRKNDNPFTPPIRLVQWHKKMRKKNIGHVMLALDEQATKYLNRNAVSREGNTLPHATLHQLLA